MEAVTHELKVMEALPPRKTLLNDQLATIARHPEWYGKAVQIGSYAKVSAANGAKHLLQQRWGKLASDQGWTFATRHIVEDGEDRTGLFAIFTPQAVANGKEVSAPDTPEAEAKPKAKAATKVSQAERDARLARLDELQKMLDESRAVV